MVYYRVMAEEIKFLLAITFQKKGDMDIRNHIKVTYRNFSELRKLECVKDVKLKSEHEVVLHIKPDCTKGLPLCREGDYLIQFSSGLWQRVGGDAFMRLTLKPSKEKWKFKGDGGSAGCVMRGVGFVK